MIIYVRAFVKVAAVDPCSTNVCARSRLDFAVDCVVVVWLGGVDMTIECMRPHYVQFSRVPINECPWRNVLILCILVAHDSPENAIGFLLQPN